jgi:hypothetical protein
MNAKIEADIELDNHLQKCRCCFRILENTDKVVDIDEIVQRNFYDLTNIEVRVLGGLQGVNWVNLMDLTENLRF